MAELFGFRSVTFECSMLINKVVPCREGHAGVCDGTEECCNIIRVLDTIIYLYTGNSVCTSKVKRVEQCLTMHIVLFMHYSVW